MNTKQYAASSLLVALLITNTSPWIPLAMANPVVPNSSRLGPQMDVASNGISIIGLPVVRVAALVLINVPLLIEIPLGFAIIT